MPSAIGEGLVATDLESDYATESPAGTAFKLNSDLRLCMPNCQLRAHEARQLWQRSHWVSRAKPGRIVLGPQRTSVGCRVVAREVDLRHFRASALISTGADIAAVSKAMGHKHSVTNDLYGNPSTRPARRWRPRRPAWCPVRTGTGRRQTMIPNKSLTSSAGNEERPRRRISDEAVDLGFAGGQGRGRTADLPIFSRTLVPTELPGQARSCYTQGGLLGGRVSSDACRV